MVISHLNNYFRSAGYVVQDMQYKANICSGYSKNVEMSASELLDHHVGDLLELIFLP